MLLEIMLRDEFKKGKAEGISQGMSQIIIGTLSELGILPDNLYQLIMKEKNTDKLIEWNKKAAK